MLKCQPHKTAFTKCPNCPARQLTPLIRQLHIDTNRIKSRILRAAGTYLGVFGANVDAAHKIAHLIHCPRVNFIAENMASPVHRLRGIRAILAAAAAAIGVAVAGSLRADPFDLLHCGRRRCRRFSADRARRLHLGTLEADWIRCAEVERRRGPYPLTAVTTTRIAIIAIRCCR